MNNQKVKRTIFSLFFLLGGGAILAVYALGLGQGIGLFSIISTIFLACVSLAGIFSFNFVVGAIPLAIIAEIWKVQIGLEAVNVWILILAALLIGIGFDIIFSKPRRKRRLNRQQSHCGSRRNYGENFEEYTHMDDHNDFHGRYSTETIENEEHVVANVDFAGQDKYIRSQNLKSADLSCRMGSLKVFFENCKPSEEGIEINLDVSFGSVELYIPRTWNIDDKLQATAASVEGATVSSGDYITVPMTGRVSFGSVKIIYI